MFDFAILIRIKKSYELEFVRILFWKNCSCKSPKIRKRSKKRFKFQFTHEKVYGFGPLSKSKTENFPFLSFLLFLNYCRLDTLYLITKYNKTLERVWQIQWLYSRNVSFDFILHVIWFQIEKYLFSFSDCNCEVIINLL